MDQPADTGMFSGLQHILSAGHIYLFIIPVRGRPEGGLSGCVNDGITAGGGVSHGFEVENIAWCTFVTEP